MKFFLDHCVGNSVGEALQAAGHDVIRLRDEMAVDSADALVIAKAEQLDAVLVSLNGDFADDDAWAGFKIVNQCFNPLAKRRCSERIGYLDEDPLRRD